MFEQTLLTEVCIVLKNKYSYKRRRYNVPLFIFHVDRIYRMRQWVLTSIDFGLLAKN